MTPGLAAAIERAGGKSQLADAMGVYRNAVEYWCRRGVPAERAVAIEAALGIPRHALRPDLWPAPAR